MNRWRRWVVPGITLLGVIAAAVVIPAVDADPDVEIADPTTTTTVATAPGPGVDGDTIVLGVLAVTSGSGGQPGRSLLAGHTAFWDAAGSVAGWSIKLDVQEGALDPETSDHAYRNMHDDVAMISSSMGTSLIAPEASGEGILVVADSTLDVWGLTSNVIPNAGAAAPADEVRAGLHWAYTGLFAAGSDPAGIVVAGDVAGAECMEGFDSAFTDLGFEAPVVEIGERGSAGDAVEASRQAGVRVALVCHSPAYLAEFTSIAAASDYDVVVIATSMSYDPRYADVLGGNVFVVTAMPPWESDLPGVAAMRRAAAESGLGAADVDPAFYYGYTQAATAAAVIETAAGSGPVGRAGFIDALAAGVEVDLQMGGVPVVIGLDSAERIPDIAVGIYVPAPTTQRAFGLEPVVPPFVAPAGG